jgi:hypothetical protein
LFFPTASHAATRFTGRAVGGFGSAFAMAPPIERVRGDALLKSGFMTPPTRELRRTTDPLFR